MFEEYRAVQVPLTDDVEENVGGIGAVASVFDLVDDEDVGMHAGREGVAEATLAGRDDELVDEGWRHRGARLEAVLDGARALARCV